MTKRIIEASAGVIYRDGKILITKRHDDAHLGGLWEFPGGKREPGESFEDCLHRELKEELGIEVKIGAIIETVEHDYGDKHVLIKFYHCNWTRNEPQALEVDDFKWVAPKELKN